MAGPPFSSGLEHAWVRQRYPDFYRNGHLLSGGMTGKEIMQRVWAGYLDWADR